jgi:hypothetical protein
MTSCEACKRAKRGVCRAHTGSLQRNLRDPVSREWWRRLLAVLDAEREKS